MSLLNISGGKWDKTAFIKFYTDSNGAVLFSELQWVKS